MEQQGSHRHQRIAFQLSQLGSLSSSRFAERTRELGLSPSDAGTLRLIGRTPGLSQRALANLAGAAPSRMVSVIDSLQERGLVERVRSNTDRRNYELQLSPDGEAKLRQLRQLAESHEAEMLAPLTIGQAKQLGELLTVLSAGNGLSRDLHIEIGS